MARPGLLHSIALTGVLLAAIGLAGCDKGKRTAHAETSVASAEVSTKLPPSEVSDEFLQATATVAADAVSVPHPVAAAVVVPPPEPVVPPAGNAATNSATAPMRGNAATDQMPPPADGGSNAMANKQ